MQVKREAKIYPRHLPSGNTSFRVDMGMVNGKRKTKDFAVEAQAIALKSKWDAALQQKQLGALQDLLDVQKKEVMLAIERIRPFGVSVLDAVDFYAKFAVPSGGPITVENGIAKLQKNLRRVGRSERYIKGAYASYFKPFQKRFSGRLCSEITTSEVEGFIFANNAKTGKPRGAKTISNYFANLEVLFNFLIRQGHCTLDPLTPLDRPVNAESKGTYLKVDDVSKLLQQALDAGKKHECASMALVFFCGVRVEEVPRLTWSDVNFSTSKIHLEAEATKKGKRRINPIPVNAIEWLRRCKGEGKISPKNYKNRLRSVRKEAEVKYIQNQMRHSFASYHIAMNESAHLTAYLLGHPDANLLYNTYRDLASKEEALRFFDIVPSEVIEQREAAAREADEAEKMEALAGSNCGEVERNPQGKWVAVRWIKEIEPESNPFE